MTLLSGYHSLSDIAALSGHVGYSWDLARDQINWFGPTDQLFDAAGLPFPTTPKAWTALIANDDRAQFLDMSADFIERVYRLGTTGQIWVHEHGRIVTENGKAVLRQSLICRVQDPDRAPIVTAHADLLTGLPNRTAMLDQIRRLLNMSQLTSSPCLYLVASIDKMAFLNEALGLEAANAVLRGAAARLQSLCPPDTIIGRVGGDMFGVLLTGPAALSAAHLIKTIMADFHDRTLATPAAPLHISVSIGSAPVVSTVTDPIEIMIRAEQALSLARHKGRSEYMPYIESAERARASRATLEIGERVKTALKNGGLKLAFQPVVDAQTKEIIFYEALARLFRDDGSLMAAADFIPVVEQLGLAPEFDRHVLDLAIKDLDAHPDLRLAVNISGLTATLSDWPDFVQSFLSAKPDVAERLIIEITETAAIMDVAETKLLVESLKKMGSQVALDDFGAGSTSIRHLRNLSLAIMKIDKDLLENLLTSVEQQHLVRMLIRIAHGLNLKTVVEGIETPDVAEWLRLEKADMLQGYYFGYPTLDRPWDQAKTPQSTVLTPPPLDRTVAERVTEQAASCL